MQHPTQASIDHPDSAAPHGPAGSAVNSGGASSANTADPPIVELRRYMLHFRQHRDALIDLFDREFIEPQESLGMRVTGQFRDLDRPDQFVWLRGFADMPARASALAAFYDGPVWAAHRDAANATMRSSDDVLLLRPAWAGAAALAPQPRSAPGVAAEASAAVIDLTVFHLRGPADVSLLAFCRDRMVPVLQRGGARQQAWYVTEPSTNNFPRLPVREGEPVLVGLAVFQDPAALQAFADSGVWRSDVAPGLTQWLSARPPELHRLQPTARSAVRG